MPQLAPPSSRTSFAFVLPHSDEQTEFLSALQLPPGRPLIILNGSTHASLTVLYARITPLLQAGLAAWLAHRGAVAITGGTNAGIFALLGRGFADYGQPAACIGVTVAACLRHPERNPHGVALEPHHTHSVLTAGQHWGDETALMYALAAAYAPVAQSLTLVVGGGPLTLNEVEASVAQGRRILAVAESGGVADALLAAAAGQGSADPRLQHLATQAHLYRIEADAAPAHLGRLLDHLLLGAPI